MNTCLLRSLALLVLIGMLASPPSYGEDTAVESSGRWVQLFNGRDLTGWTPKFVGQELGVNFRDTFRVEDGVLKIDYANWDRFDGEFGHLFYDTPFSHYQLRVEYRFVGKQLKDGPGWAKRNNGVMIHGQAPGELTLDQDFPDSIEVQLLGGLSDGKPRGTLNICTPGTQLVLDGKLTKQHVISAGGPTYHGDDWVTIELEVRGDQSIKHLAEGEVVIEYSQPQLDDGTPLTGGTISIQAETHPTEFRKIELLPLAE